MICVLNTKYKSIGNILVIPSVETLEPFYVKSPIDFLLDYKDNAYTVTLRYNNYHDSFDYLSCKLIATLESFDSTVCLLYLNNYLTPDPDSISSGSGYCFTYKIRYNNNSKTDLFLSFISSPLHTNYTNHNENTENRETSL